MVKYFSKALHYRRKILTFVFVLVIISILWFIFVMQTFNINHMFLTLQHRHELANIIETIISDNSDVNYELPSVTVYVRVIYERSNDCYISFSILSLQTESSQANFRGFYRHERDEEGDWSGTGSENISLQNLLLGQPGQLSCS